MKDDFSFEDLDLDPSLAARLNLAAEMTIEDLKDRLGLPEKAGTLDVFREALAKAKAATTNTAHDNDNRPRS